PTRCGWLSHSAWPPTSSRWPPREGSACAGEPGRPCRFERRRGRAHPRPPLASGPNRGFMAPLSTHPATPAQPRRGVMNRYEVKYLVATGAVPALIHEFRDYGVADPNCRDEFGYQIFSVYWDTADWLFFWEKVEGVKYRRKLRFRRYADSPDVFLEVKQREDRTLQKRRLRWPVERAVEVF